MTITPPPRTPHDRTRAGATAVILKRDAEGRLAEDLPCRGCGYNLRGLDESGLCPECSAPVGRSVTGDLLRFADPQWVERLVTGLGWAIVGILAGIVTNVLVTVTFQFLIGAAIMRGGTPSGFVFGIPAVLSFITSLMTVYGVWLATTPEPSAIESEPPFSARRLTRWCYVAQLAAGPLQAMGYARMNPAVGNTLGITGPIDAVFTVTGFAAAIAGLVGLIAGLIYLRRLAIKIPDTSLARQTRIVAWGIGSCQSLMIAWGIVVAFAMSAWMGAGAAAPTTPPTGVFTLMTVMCFLLIAAFVFTIWALVLLLMYRGKLATAAKQARSTWATDSASAPM